MSGCILIKIILVVYEHNNDQFFGL